jgi:hypothetical protein
MALAVVGGYVVDVPQPTAWVVRALDGSGAVFYPERVTGFGMEAATLNVEHELIDGSLAVALGGDALRTGVLAFRFSSDSAAMAARTILGRRASFQITLPARPAFSIRFVRRGSLSTTVHDQIRHLWLFECGYREVTA